jgi:hypothetical protein
MIKRADGARIHYDMLADMYFKSEARVTELSAELDKLKAIAAAADEVLRVYMPQFTDSRAVDDCLVGLAAAVAGVQTSPSTAP